MKKAEAFQILGIAETATPEEIKKAFRDKAKKLHPDVNKEADAETQFKKANEAYQNIEKNTFDDNMPNFGGMPFSGGFNIQDIFGFGNRRPRRNSPPPRDIYSNQTISFKESILGCKKDLTYTCDIMCDKCEGNGEKLVDNGCTTCGGKGRIMNQQGNMFFERACHKCAGKVKYEKCLVCSAQGKLNSKRTVTISIDPGIHDGAILRLVSIGNFAPLYGYSNVLVTVKVTAEPNLTLQDNDVVSHITISLLEALTGCEKQIITIDGMQNITIPPTSKNKDEVILSKLGVGRQGNERVIVNVEYPKDTTSLIELLKT